MRFINQQKWYLTLNFRGLLIGTKEEKTRPHGSKKRLMPEKDLALVFIDGEFSESRIAPILQYKSDFYNHIRTNKVREGLVVGYGRTIPGKFDSVGVRNFSRVKVWGESSTLIRISSQINLQGRQATGVAPGDSGGGLFFWDEKNNRRVLVGSLYGVATNKADGHKYAAQNNKTSYYETVHVNLTSRYSREFLKKHLKVTNKGSL